jgi:hypothetical protein
MLTCLRVYVEWLETNTCWNQKNCGYSICIGSTSSWIGWNDYVVTTIGFVMETIGSTNIASFN